MTKKIVGVFLILAAASTSLFFAYQAFSQANYAPKKGDLIKLPDSIAVYYIDDNLIKHLFPTQAIFFTWFGGSWSDQKVITIGQSRFDSIAGGDNIIARPGTNLVRFSGDDRVYAVTFGGKLCQVINNYGYNWPDRIISVESTFRGDYQNQPDCVVNNMSKLPNAVLFQYFGSSTLYYIQDGKKRLVTENGFKANGFRLSSIVKDVNPLMTYPDGAILDERDPLIAEVYPPKPQACAENWFCSDWSACSVSSTQDRSCTELSGCGTEISRPTSSRACKFANPMLCQDVKCEDKCDGPNLLSRAVCHSGNCLYQQFTRNAPRCLDGKSFTCSQLAGEICSTGETCAGANALAPDQSGKFLPASDSAACCDINDSEISGCAFGDLAIGGPYRISKDEDGWILTINNFKAEYLLKRNGFHLPVGPINGELYLDGQLVYSGKLLDGAGSDIFSSGTHDLIFKINDLPEKSIRLTIDTGNAFNETDENNNIFLTAIK